MKRLLALYVLASIAFSTTSLSFLPLQNAHAEDLSSLQLSTGGATAAGPNSVGTGNGSDPSANANPGGESGGGGGGDSHTITLFSMFCGKASGVGIKLFISYFNCIWPWLLSVGGGMAVLNAVIGGTMMMISGGDSGLQSMGKQKIMYSILGLLIIAFAGTILRTLNPDFFQ